MEVENCPAFEVDRCVGDKGLCDSILDSLSIKGNNRQCNLLRDFHTKQKGANVVYLYPQRPSVM